MLIMNWINNTILQLAECPYFIVFSGACSIFSVFTLSTIAYFMHPTIKPAFSPEIADALTQKLIDAIYPNNQFKHIFSFTVSAPDFLPNVVIEKIDFQSSFTLMYSSNLMFHLVKYRRHLYLFASCCSLYMPTVKCIASNKKTKSLNLLLKTLHTTFDTNDTSFIENIFAPFK